MRTAICCLFLAIATPAMAFRARPVSDLRFEETTYGQPAAAASDGTDYLVVIEREDQGYINLYTQLISQGAPYGPAVLIGQGYSKSVIWTGSQYLVAWGDRAGVYLSAVSRRGALMSAPRLIISGYPIGAPKAVSNGRRILVTMLTDTQIVGAFADLNGQPIGSVFPMAERQQAWDYALTSAGDGFALVRISFETHVFRFDEEGKPLLAGGTRVGGQGVHGAIASDGTNVTVIFTSYDGLSTGASTLKIAVIGTRGEIVQPPRFLWSGTDVGSLLWNGSEYVSARRTDYSTHDTTETSVRLQRISRMGELLDTELFLTVPATSPVLASNGREYLITLNHSYIRLPIGSSSPTEVVELARSVDSQEALAMSWGPRDLLAVWRETDHNGSKIVASRIDATGRYLDGTGIVVATFSDPYSLPMPSVDSDGRNWLVVWNGRGVNNACRISPEGVILDPKPIAFLVGSVPVVRWGGNSWLVVGNLFDGRMRSATITSDGRVSPIKIFDDVTAYLTRTYPYGNPVYKDPVLAFDGQQFVVAFSEVVTLGFSGPMPVEEYSIVTERLSADGDSIMGSRFVLPRYADNLSIASNGPQTLVVFTDGALLLNRGYAPTTTVIDDGPFTYVPWSGSPFWIQTATTWNGSEFVVAVATQERKVRLIHTSPLGYTSDVITLPRNSGEHTHGVVFPPSSRSGTDVLGLLTQHEDAYEGASRAELAFAGDVIDARVQQLAPAAPVISKAIGDPSGVTITWQPQDGVLGFEIELRQSDGTERIMGIAAGRASSTHIPYAGLTGTAIRLRAWNAAGLSAPSSEMSLTMPRVRAAPK
jgi:hypothetical protein